MCAIENRVGPSMAQLPIVWHARELIYRWHEGIGIERKKRVKKQPCPVLFKQYCGCAVPFQSHETYPSIKKFIFSIGDVQFIAVAPSKPFL